MHQLDLMGFSGFKVDLIKTESYYYVEKSTQDTHLKDRLKRQFEKQKQYSEIIKNFPHKSFCVPTIVQSEETNNSFSFQMSYSNSLNYLDFFENSSVFDIDSFLNRIFFIIDEFITLSENKIEKKETIKEKYSNTKKNIISKKISSPLFFQELDYIFDLKEDLLLPMGYCHGDLTFSNMLFDVMNKKIVLIDFLDSFIESPLLDIVKLRQDTKFLWSMNLCKKDFDIIKINIIFNYLDKKINDYFSKYEFYSKFYSLFQILNLLRVLQYAKDEHISKILEKNINDEKFNYSSSR